MDLRFRLKLYAKNPIVNPKIVNYKEQLPYQLFR